MNTVHIDTLKGGKRLSTQQLLQLINSAVEAGETSFDILGAGQHDIGGPLWSKEGKQLYFRVKNPGQRVGSMGMFGTNIVVEGSAPADAGWLNSGAEITLLGDGGDTTAHCAASGHIYVAGRVGTRSGALMKFDPKYPAPEFWVLKNTGSFSFEFMGGGVAVVCGVDCDGMASVLGTRSCAGMVGGTVYVRGPVADLANDVYLLDLDDADKDFLAEGLPRFLSKIDRADLTEELTDLTAWKKIVPKTFEERKAVHRESLKEFRLKKWVKGGIFSDMYPDDFEVVPLVTTGKHRLRIPSWNNDKMKAPCETRCPIGIPTQKRLAMIRAGLTEAAAKMIFNYTPFPACVCGTLCPNLCMDACNRQYVDESVHVAALARLSQDLPVPAFETTRKEKVAVVGAGVGGLSAAWQLRKSGCSVDVFESDDDIGGKLRQVIPEQRLPRERLDAELTRLKNAGIAFRTGVKITKDKFDALRTEYDAVLIACGAHAPVVLPVEGADRLVKGLDFLKQINRSERPTVGKDVVVIGAGNAAMDVIIGAYGAGAQRVTAVDVQKPAAFAKEIAHAESLGATIEYPFFTQKITADGVYSDDGRFLKADTVIISIGDRPVFDFLDKSFTDEKGRINLNDYLQTDADDKVFVVGDAIKQGLFTHAIADGLKAARNMVHLFDGTPMEDFSKAPMLPQDRVRTEYYHGMASRDIETSPACAEKDRCLSCGSCRDCEFCLNACPQQAIVKTKDDQGKSVYSVDETRCIGCGICAGVCPCGVWTMSENL